MENKKEPILIECGTASKCKVQYQSPILTVYGNVEELTRANNNGDNSDAFGTICGEGNPSLPQSCGS